MRRYFVVSFEMPAGATAAAARDYIWDAVGTMKDCLQPYDPHNEDESERGDPMAELDDDSVRVTVGRAKHADR